MPWSVLDLALRVRIRTEGVLAAVGHDRVFAVPASVTIEGSADLVDASVCVECDLTRVALVGEIADKDRREILQRTHDDVLLTRRYPVARFVGKYDAVGNQLLGQLQLHGETQPCNLPVWVVSRPDGIHAEGTVSIDLQPFGIKPYRALLGALRVKPEVEVSYSLTAILETKS